MKQIAIILGIALLGIITVSCYLPPSGPDTARVRIVGEEGLKANIARVDGKAVFKGQNDFYTFKPGTHKLGVVCGKGDKMGKIRELTLEVPSAGEFEWHLTPVMDRDDISDIKCKLEKVR